MALVSDHARIYTCGPQRQELTSQIIDEARPVLLLGTRSLVLEDDI